MGNVIDNIKTKIETNRILNKELLKICEYLKDIAPREYIEKQARKNIKSIKYVHLNEGLLGNYSYENNEIILDINSDESTLVHEILHAITDRSVDSRGFKRKDEKDKTIKGAGIDEAITEELAQRITSIEKKDIEAIGRNAYKVFSTCIDENFFLKDYILGTNTVEDEIDRQYGQEVLKKYQDASFYLDALAVASTFYAHLNNEEEDYFNKLEKAKKVMNISSKELPNVVKSFAEECVKIKKQNYSLNEYKTSNTNGIDFENYYTDTSNKQHENEER